MNTTKPQYSPATLAMFAAADAAKATFTDFEKGLWRQKIDASTAVDRAESELKEAQRAVVEARRKLRVAQQDSLDVDQVFLSTRGGVRWQQAVMADYSAASNLQPLVLEHGTARDRPRRQRRRLISAPSAFSAVKKSVPMKPALLIGHAIAQRLAQLAVAEARVALLTANLADQLPGAPEWNAALAKLGAAQAALAELRGEQPTVVTP